MVESFYDQDPEHASCLPRVVPCQIIHIIKYNYPFITPFIRFSAYVGMDGRDKSSLQTNA